MARLDGRSSRTAISNADFNSGAQYVYAGPDTSGLGTFDASNFQFDTAFGAPGHGWYTGTGFVTGGVAPHVPVAGTVNAINVDFLGGSTADLIIDQISVSLVLLAAGDQMFFQNSIFDGDDLLLGSIFNDALYGYGGNDVIYGFGGDDLLVGGAGDDRLFGGWGDDVLFGENGEDALFGEGGEDILVGGVNHDQLFGGSGDDLLSGFSGRDRLDGGTGVDRMWGGTGSDVYVVRNILDEVIENSGEGNDTVISFVGYTLAADVENLTLHQAAGAVDGTGNDLRNRIIGNNDANILSGLAGNDTLLGGNGNDTMLGGDGRDIMHGGGGGDVMNGGSQNDVISGQTGADTIDGGTGHDRISGGDGADNLDGNSGDDRLDGGDGNDVMFGGSGHDFLQGGLGTDTLHGGTGNDILNGGAEADVMRGGDGNDIYFVDNANDRVLESAGQGLDVVFSTVSTSLRANVENLRLLEAAGISYGAGNSLNNTIYGNSFANALLGKDGNDRLFAGAGEDGLFGGTGNDVMDGGLDGETDTFLFQIGDGNDVIRNYEHGVDRMVMDGLVFADLTISTRGTGMQIDYGTGDGIYLMDVGILALTAADFSFI